MDARIALLISELKSQREDILSLHAKIAERLSDLQKEPDNEAIRDSLGYKLHNLYCAYEDLFKIVARFFENHIDDASRYHTLLLKRMKLDIAGVRPALISDETFKILNELRAFRHFFRHAYIYELDTNKLIDLAKKCAVLRELFIEDFEKFVDSLVRENG